MIKIDAHAKINWGLNVLYKRDDGYHELDGVMQLISLHDTLFFGFDDEDGISVVSSPSTLPCGRDNLAYTAAESYYKQSGIRPSLMLLIEKRIPMQAGLAGASADAAAVLRGLNARYCAMSQDDLTGLGKKLGADVPFCLQTSAARARGIGDVLTPISCKHRFFVLVAKPNGGVNTAEAFKSATYGSPNDIDNICCAIESGDTALLAQNMGNAFQRTAEKLCPGITEIMRIMSENGALNASLTGSGSSVIGLFETEKALNYAYESISGKVFWACPCTTV